MLELAESESAHPYTPPYNFVLEDLYYSNSLFKVYVMNCPKFYQQVKEQKLSQIWAKSENESESYEKIITAITGPTYNEQKKLLVLSGCSL